MPTNLPIRIAPMSRDPEVDSATDVPAQNREVISGDPGAATIGVTPIAAEHGPWNWRPFFVAGMGIVFLALALAAFFLKSGFEPIALEQAQHRNAARPAETRSMEPQAKAVMEFAQGAAAPAGFAPAAPPPPPNPQVPMIARTVSLTIFVKDFAASRMALDRILAQAHGYPGSLTVNTPEEGGHSLQASLRVPAADLATALAGLRTLGHVLSETQSGEEVTQQHADLVARLENSREEETRLRAILEQRTGRIEDVLQVEEAIARVRGEIESMEAEQKSLEHRVDFATVDLQLTEEYKRQLNPSGESASARMYNAFIAGLRNASGTVLGIVLFAEEFGPAIFVWLAILGVPVWFIWRRYRKTRAAM